MTTTTKTDTYMPAPLQARHTRLVTELMMSACGDLILDQRGHLCRREIWEEDQPRIPGVAIINYPTGKELPWAQHRIGERLAIITRCGWILTSEGAQFILENCPPEGKTERADVKCLQTVAKCRDTHLVGVRV